MRRIFVIAGGIGAMLLALSGCVSPEQLRAQDEAACSAYGFLAGTPDFARCMQQENLSRRNSYSYSYDPYFYGPPHPWWGWR